MNQTQMLFFWDSLHNNTRLKPQETHERRFSYGNEGSDRARSPASMALACKANSRRPAAARPRPPDETGGGMSAESHGRRRGSFRKRLRSWR